VFVVKFELYRKQTISEDGSKYHSFHNLLFMPVCFYPVNLNYVQWWQASSLHLAAKQWSHYHWFDQWGIFDNMTTWPIDYGACCSLNMSHPRWLLFSFAFCNVLIQHFDNIMYNIQLSKCWIYYKSYLSNTLVYGGENQTTSDKITCLISYIGKWVFIYL
jgi:hypothetical protein